MGFSFNAVTPNDINKDVNSQRNSITEASDTNSNTLEEELSLTDLIIEGTVSEEKPSYKMDAGIDNPKVNFTFDVTPVTIQVNKVLSGDTSLKEINYLQHGTSNQGSKFKKGNKVVLMLVKTTSGDYWSYNFEDGEWLIEDGKVQSKSKLSIYKALNGLDTVSFSEKISKNVKISKENK